MHVRVGRDPEGLAVDVTNGPGGVLLEPSEVGHGLVGMRERAQMYAGHLEAGHNEEGGWTVRARLPTSPWGPPLSPSPIRVLLADDQSLVRNGFRLMLEQQPDFSVVRRGSRRRGGRPTRGASFDPTWS